jgi:predicted 2-oxoglutarate/Fe(II)-dependent dioxygenase YbiX
MEEDIMHTEEQLRRAIRPLLELYGELTTTEVKNKLGEFVDYDDEDLEESDTRNEVKVTQRIGNIVAHQTESIHSYTEGFSVNKNFRPAVFTLLTGLSNNQQPIDSITVQKKKALANTVQSQQRINKVDWQQLQHSRDEIGVKGEIFIFEKERDKVNSFDPNSVGRVIHLSATEGDGYGYDIVSIDCLGNPIYIEVKTTTGNINTPFYMSKNEKDFFENHINDNAVIYRVYDFNTASGIGKIKIISAQNLFSDYKFDPITFKVSKK